MRPPRGHSSRVLLLQGPIGPFFNRFAAELRSFGAQVTKINFNAGDWIFYPSGISFRGPARDWKDFLRRVLEDRRIERVYLFGDCRPIHEAAVQVAKAMGVAVYVFEEGYLRPDYITLEHNGVNGNSDLPAEANAYRNAALSLEQAEPPVSVGRTFFRSAIFATVYAIFITLGRLRYPRYTHHRCFNMWKQGAYWLRSGWRKVIYKFRERGVLQRLLGSHSNRYFFVPLQVHCDAQIKHSDYSDVRDFIEEVVAEFSRAPACADCLLVLKHHPRDRGYRDYSHFIERLGHKYDCANRLVYLHDQHLPSLLVHARGAITINSTVGLSALYHQTPVKVMGAAVYNIDGLTDTRSLSDFFSAPNPIDTDLYQAFTQYLHHTNQINGNFYKRLHSKTSTGLCWPRSEEGDKKKRLNNPTPLCPKPRKLERSSAIRPSSEIRAVTAEEPHY